MISAGPASRRRALLVSHLERLDTQSGLAFVAAVWRARGFETTTDGDIVVATRRGHTTVLAPVCGRWTHAVSTPMYRTDGGDGIDVVVSLGNDRRGRALASTHGSRHVDSVALVEMLLYALDRQEANRLCDRHLGAPIDELLPPLRTRVSQRIAHSSRRIARVARPTTRSVVMLAVIVLAVSGGVVSLGLVESPVERMTQQSAGSAGETAPEGGTQPTVEPYEQPTPATPATDSSTAAASTAPPFVGNVGRGELEPLADGDLDSVPGVTRDGITNLSALSEAHGEVISNRSYTLWLDTYQPRDTDPNASRVQYDTDVAVSGDSYLIVESVEAGRERTHVRTVNYDGRDWYVVDHQNGTDRTRRIHGETADPPVQFEPRQLNPSLVRQYLATRTTNVTGKVRVNNVTYYRVEGSQRPSIGGVEPVENYRFVAFVDDEGFVTDATVTYTLVSDSGSYPVQFEWTYGNLDSTMVSRPSWGTVNETDDDTNETSDEKSVSFAPSAV